MMVGKDHSERAWRLARLAAGLMRRDRIESDALATAESLVNLAATRIKELDHKAVPGPPGCGCSTCTAARESVGAL